MVTHEVILSWLLNLESLTIFRGIQKHEGIQKLARLCELLLPILERGNTQVSIDEKRLLSRTWGDFIATLLKELDHALVGDLKVTLDGAPADLSLYNLIAHQVLKDENPLTLSMERTLPEDIPDTLKNLAYLDLELLYRMSQLDLASLGETLGDITGIVCHLPLQMHLPAPKYALPLLKPDQNWVNALHELGRWIHSHGAGILGQHHAFIWKHVSAKSDDASGSRALHPVLNADPISLQDLSGYEAQRAVVLDNTRRFMEGKPANNLLLYGDRGTGKSATVKAVCRAFADQGLKLIEVRKRDILHFEAIAETLSHRGLRFVLFIDDLSFEETDDTFTGLKALLEGGLERRPTNMVIYATSNRRHLVKERFADRPTTAMAAEAIETGDVRAFDTMQEQLSLADRFGVTVVFTAPTQDEYLSIAEAIAERRGILPSGADRTQFRANALRWERWFNGRSPRTAQQYVDWLAGGEGFPWE